MYFSYTGKEYGVKDVVEGMQYEFRVSAINNSGAGESSTPSEFVFARDPKSRWTFRTVITVIISSTFQTAALNMNHVLQSLLVKSWTLK